MDLTAYLDFNEGKRYAGTLSVECRYNHGMEVRCDGRGSPEVTTSGTDDLLSLAASNACSSRELLRRSRMPLTSAAGAVPTGQHGRSHSTGGRIGGRMGRGRNLNRATTAGGRHRSTWLTLARRPPVRPALIRPGAMPQLMLRPRVQRRRSGRGVQRTQHSTLPTSSNASAASVRSTSVSPRRPSSARRSPTTTPTWASGRFRGQGTLRRRRTACSSWIPTSRRGSGGGANRPSPLPRSSCRPPLRGMSPCVCLQRRLARSLRSLPMIFRILF
jgi:hypothetical protein